jgi:hypothetical protein
LFILAGEDLKRRFAVQRLFSEDHLFAKQQVLRVEPAHDGEPAMSGKLVMDQEAVERSTVGRVSRPRFGMDFPAERIETEM